LPDKWSRDFYSKTPLEQISFVLGCCAEFVVGVSLLWWLFHLLRSAHLDWRQSIKFAVVPMVLYIGTLVTYAHLLFESYSTTMPLTNFFTLVAAGVVLGGLGIGVLGAAAMIVSCASFDGLNLHTSVNAILSFAFRPAPKNKLAIQRQFWLDGTLAGYFAGFTFLSGWILTVALSQRISPSINLWDIYPFIGLANSSSPAWTVTIIAILSGMSSVLLAPAVAAVYRLFFQSAHLRFFAAVLIISAVSCSEHYWQDQLIESLLGSVVCIAIWCWVRLCARANPIAYFVGAYTTVLTIAIWSLARFAPMLFANDLYILGGVLACPLVYLYFIYLNDSVGTSNASAAEADNSTPVTPHMVPHETTEIH
jgi:hypothetical protein